MALLTIADPFTEKFDWNSVLKEKGADFTQEFINDLNKMRQMMADTLANQPGSSLALERIVEYLKYLLAVVDIFEKNGEASTVKFSKLKWRSIISKGIRMSLNSSVVEKPIISGNSIYFEVIEAIFAYGASLYNMAAKKMSSGSFSGITETNCNEIAELLSKAAGVFVCLSDNWCVRWSNKKDAPPECHSPMLYTISLISIADANRAALAKAEKRGMSPSTLLKLECAILDNYKRAAQSIQGLGKDVISDVSDLLISYVKDGALFVEASCLKKYAVMQNAEEQNGNAVAAMTKAYNNLVKCSTSQTPQFKKSALEMMGEYEELRSTYIRVNNNITYQKVPDPEDVTNTLPSGRLVVESKPFTPPEKIMPQLTPKETLLTGESTS